MRTSELRKTFIRFFESKQHIFIPGASTIPVGDQTILFTIAGMTQFKGCLTGEEVRSYKRATNAQKCIRVTDLDDVGKDGRHLTMFEMLGSWSFGDYYKQEAIAWAYEFVKEEIKLDLNLLWITVHHTDDEAFALWKSIGVPENRIVRLGDKDNFWAMGPVGPCGPCSELYFDQGETVGSCYEKGQTCQGPGCDCDRYLEFWNLVFMQFNRMSDGTLTDLPMKSVDTGCGLERLAALMQGKHSAFDIDLMQKIKKQIYSLSLSSPGLTGGSMPGSQSDEFSDDMDVSQNESCNIIADHIRLLVFTLADGANFSNEGRGYVLRRVLRRAVRYAHRLCPTWPKNQSFLAKIVKTVVDEMGDFYPEIIENQTRIENFIQDEEIRFHTTLESGLAKFNVFVQEALKKNLKVITGENIFILHDSFGFPSDLTRILCEEINLKADLEGFQKCMQEQKERGRMEAKFYKFEKDDSDWVTFHFEHAGEDKNFAGYHLQTTSIIDEQEISEVEISYSHVKKMRQLKNKMFELVIANTPFYPEGGGQVCDRGWFVVTLASGKKLQFEVMDVRKTVNNIVHLLRHAEYSSEDASSLTVDEIKNIFSARSKVTAFIDFTARKLITANHTATHLMHKALQVILGDNVRQAGSLVTSMALRFDFSYNKALTVNEIERVEQLVNGEIFKNTPVKKHESVSLADAKKMGAMAMFDEKYEDFVRVLEIPKFSLELCGGTHVAATGEIGLFKIVSEGSVTSGVRRIEAVTGQGVLLYLQKLKNNLAQIAEAAKCPEAEIINRVVNMRENYKGHEIKISQLQSRVVNAKVLELLQSAVEIDGKIKLVTCLYDASDLKEMELLCDRLKEKQNIIVVLAANIEGSAHLIVAVDSQLIKINKQISAGNLVKQLSELVGGKGGGKPDFARGGGSKPDKIPLALAKAEEIVRGYF